MGIAGCGDSDGGAGAGGSGGSGGSGGGSPSLSGIVREAPGGAVIPNARVTLVDGSRSYLDEARTATDGSYAFSPIAAGSYTVGASALRREYKEAAVMVSGATRADFSLGAETQTGRWTVVGDTNPEFFIGTPSATVMSDGRVFYCHSTVDPVVFDPISQTKFYPMMGPTTQGCHMQTVLTDGRIIFVGGQNGETPGDFVNGVRRVKIYDPASNTWAPQPDLNQPRWYPTLIRFPDERLMACGGGQPPNAQRTATCEIWNPATSQWTLTGSMLNPAEYSPSALLMTGDILLTWYPPQLYSLSTGQWRATGNFVQPNRGYPGHAEHTLVVLPDGTALAIGTFGSAGPNMVEAYDPGSERWSVRASPQHERVGAEVVPLPDGRILVAGGHLEDGDPSVFVNQWGQVKLSDLYDPSTDSWRPVADMNLAREYHALTVLILDGRVLTTSGTANQAVGPTTENSIEAFEPPYLFRGPRPRMDSPPVTTLARGGVLTVTFSWTRAPTALVLIGTNAVTHWMDGGVPRLVRLQFQQNGNRLQAQLPSDPVQLPSGQYLLFVMVDDIPSTGTIVRVMR